MGARHLLDLTPDVTHLICADLATPKYKYVARMRADVQVMGVEWVDAMYDLWINGEDINPLDFNEKYKFPTFQGLAICLTGVQDCTFYFSVGICVGLGVFLLFYSWRGCIT